MKSIAVLPYNIDVEMRTYQKQAFPLGIAKANIKNYDVWLCGKLIQNRYNANNTSQFFDMCDEDLLSEHDGFLTTQCLTATALNSLANPQELIKNNKDTIDQGCYISGAFDEFYIPKKWPFRKFHFAHDYLIYGYNDLLEVFYSAGYLENGRYDYFNISYNDYLLGVYSQHISDTYINYHKVNSSYRADLNPPIIQEGLQYYTNSNYTDTEDSLDTIYGIEAWRMLAKYVSDNKNATLDVRYGRLFMEYRYVMLERIRVLTKLEVIVDKRIANDYYNLVYSRARIVFSLFLKYNCSHKPDILSRLINLIHDTIQHELKIMNNLANGNST